MHSEISQFEDKISEKDPFSKVRCIFFYLAEKFELQDILTVEPSSWSTATDASFPNLLEGNSKSINPKY